MPERLITPSKSSKDKGKAIIASSFAGPTTVPAAAPAPNNPPRNPTQTPFRPKLPVRKPLSSSLSQPPPRSDKTAAMEVSSPPPPPQKPNKTATAAVSTALPPPPPPQKPKETAVAVVSTASPPLPPPPAASQIDNKARKRLLHVSELKYPYMSLDSPVSIKRGSGSRDPAGVTERQNSTPSLKTMDFLSQMEAETSVPVQVQRENPPNGAKLAEWGATLVLGNGKRHRVDLKLRI